MTQDRDKYAVRIARVDDDRADLLPIAQSHVFPCFAAVGRFVDAVACRKVRSLQPLATADVNDVRVRRRNRESADRSGRLIVEYRIPGVAEVRGLPDASVVDADEEDVRLSRNAGGSDGTAATEWSDHAPVKLVEMSHAERLGLKRGRNGY